MLAQLPYVRDLMAKNYEAVGFLPLPRVEDYAARGQILLQTENDDPCGYLIFGNGWPTLKVYQCCIQFDARRLDHATTLVNRLANIARSRGCYSISLWCADDLEANTFWRAYGFEFVGQRDNGNRRGRLHNRWVLRVPDPDQLSLFFRPTSGPFETRTAGTPSAAPRAGAVRGSRGVFSPFHDEDC